MPQESSETTLSYSRMMYAKHREKRRAAKREAYHKDPEASRARTRALREANPAYFRLRENRYNSTHREQRRLAEAKRRAEHPEKIRQERKTYAEKHKDVIPLRAKKQREKHREKIQLYLRNYRKVFAHLVRAHNARRRVLKRGLPVNFTPAQKTRMLQYWGYACAVCGNQEGFEWTLADDHWIPLTSPDCPGTVPWNMVPLCHGLGGCNNIKRDQDPHLWLIQHVGQYRARRIEKAIKEYLSLCREDETPLHASSM